MPEIQKAVFNEGYFQSQRLNKLQDELNDVKKNALAWNLEQNCYNYMVWFKNLQCLFNEAIGKLDKEEIITLESIATLVKRSLKYKPPHLTIVNQMKNENTTRVKRENWEFLEKLLEIYEKQVRISLDTHGLTNPNNDDGSLF